MDNALKAIHDLLEQYYDGLINTQETFNRIVMEIIKVQKED